MDIFDALGLDPETLDWKDLAICRGMPINFFFEDYENKEEVAKVIDEVCLSCPVMAQCMRTGVEDGETGVWGGVYLNNGTADDNRNKHKTKEIWKRIRERLGE